jgi:hypothetical protein
VDGLYFDSIDEVEASWFEDREVWEVVKAMNEDKASGLDGYTMEFFQACWAVLKKIECLF